MQELFKGADVTKMAGILTFTILLAPLKTHLQKYSSVLWTEPETCQESFKIAKATADLHKNLVAKTFPTRDEIYFLINNLQAVMNFN